MENFEYPIFSEREKREEKISVGRTRSFLSACLTSLFHRENHTF